jgi:ureidoacrylate peracid hydrolase
MHKIEIPHETIALSLQRRGHVQPFRSIDPRKTALLVVDMQTAFLAPGGSAEVPMAREIVGNINRLSQTLRAAGGIVVWIVSTYGVGAKADWNTFFSFVLTGEASERFRLALAEGAPGHALWPDLIRAPDDLMISKNRLTPFVDPLQSLELLLRSRGIDMVLVTGTVTSVCCESTARDAAMRNFKTIMIADANAGRSDLEHNATLSIFLQAFGGVTDTEETVRLIAVGKEPL